MFSKFFINRPIFATVLSILMVFGGGILLFTLPVAQYPDLTPPTIMVSASYPGADAKTVAEAIGVPIEQAVNGVEGMLYMQSTSGSDGSYSLTITFENGTDVDEAAISVQNLISEADATLPSQVLDQGIMVSKRQSDMLMFCSLESDKPELYDALYLTNYAQLNMMDPLSRVKGVGNAQAFGGGEYSMRVWLDPLEMRMRNLSTAEVIEAIRSQNIQVSGGSVGTQPSDAGQAFEFSVVSEGQLANASQFGDIIIRTDDTGVLRLRDVAKVELGSNSYSQTASINGKQTAMIGISQLPGANAIETAKGVRAELDRLSQYFPDGIHYNVVLDTTTYVHKSIDEVLITFVETSLIVMLVIMIFLQNWRAVIIPMITIPVSLIGTFIVMKLLGFSLNTLTLFGLVLAIALVVDDAIVVVEDCARLVDKGVLSRKQAAEKAMDELTGPVIGEVLVLLSVFIPTAFVSGITGMLYKQFALTIATATAISGFNALTLTPALCALFLTPRKDSKFFIYVWFNKFFGKVVEIYNRIVGKMLGNMKLTMVSFVAVCGVAIFLFAKWPTSYIPEEDQGYFMSAIQLPDGASLERTSAVVGKFAAEVKEVDGVKDVMAINGISFMGGGNSSNTGSLFVVLEPWGKRRNINDIIADVNEIGAGFQEAVIYSLNPPAIPGLGVTSGLSMQLLDINNLGVAEMQKALAAVSEAATADPKIASVTSTFRGTVPQYSLTLDRDKVALLGLDINNIYSTLSGYLGSTFVNDFTKFGRVFQVTLSAEGNSKAEASQILTLSVPNASGEMVPFSAFATIDEVMGSPSVTRYNMYETCGFTATPAKGVSSSEAIAAVEQLVNDTLGSNFSYAWTGEAYQETQSGTTVSTVFIFAIVLTLLVLAAQYESWTDPIAVVLVLPIAVLGCMLGCIFMGQSVSIYTQIGLIMLLGLSAKNAILIVEYAMDFRKAGVDITKSAADAGNIRFRPIMMTALAFVFGVMPMMFASGAGANSRKALGTTIVFGMAVNAVLGTLYVPSLWKLMQTINEKYLKGLFKDPKDNNATANAAANMQSDSSSGNGEGNTSSESDDNTDDSPASI